MSGAQFRHRRAENITKHVVDALPVPSLRWDRRREAGETRRVEAMKTLIAAAVLTFALTGIAGAHDRYGEKPLDANTADSFQASAASVRSEMRPGGRYAFVSTAERARIDAALADIDKVYAGHGGLDGQDAKVRVFNDQELVNAILERRGERTICSNSVATGSLVRVTKCATYAHESGNRDASLRD
jgi:hypothetical protein